MAFPTWLAALGATMGGLQQAQQQQQQQQQRQKMIQALLGQRAQQNPGGVGAMGTMGPNSWGAQNQVGGGVVHDQWGNPIGPAAQSAQGGASLPTGSTPAQAGSPASPTPLMQPDTSANTMPANTYPSPTAQSAVPFLGGPSQASPTGGVPGVSGQPGSFTSPDDMLMQALFAPQGA